MHVLYLHGFASSAQSSKAAFFRSKLAAHGVEVHTPDFNLPDFSTLTVSRMLGAGARRDPGAAARSGDAHRIEPRRRSWPSTPRSPTPGGSIAWCCWRRRSTSAATACASSGTAASTNGAAPTGWRCSTTAYGRLMPVHYELFADAARYDAFNARLDLPIQIFQGRRDTAVDPATVERWAEARPNVDLHLLDDDHQLLGSLETIWRGDGAVSRGPRLGVRP